jgi:Putative Actinobacterial Holin-X, holin superfamily III
MAIRSAKAPLSDVARRVAEHATALARLEVRLAVQEVREKSKRFLVAGGLLAAAGGLALLALTTAYAAGIAGLALVVPVWEALLIAAGAVLLVATPLGIVGYVLVKLAVPPVPEQAIVEAKLTSEAIKNGHR